MAPLTAVITGANQGIGLEIARKLAQHANTRIVMAARSEEKGRTAQAQVQADAAAGNEVLLHQLDITDSGSIARFAEWAEQELHMVDVLVNNAGFAFKGNAFGAEEAQQTIGVNFRGTANVTEALLPLIPDGGRIINVGSSAGKLSIVKDTALRERFERAARREELEKLCDNFVDAIRLGKHSQEGWPSSMYGISKLALNQYGRVLAQQLQPRGIMVATVCPGYCSTSMSSFGGSQSAEAGADTPAWLAVEVPAAEAMSKSGRFFRDRKEEPF
ncbi:hypothetical protein D9Q98_000681 [Chlorella vulgaris]|uniref:Carbonyl reductase n=1 Tax=Chlorella vulgaris TaxID=3077 RepID=A0A9D4TYI6_CHLVU|nr:hypothetical protein D9Q98_000681 [Chlorella vulgaris]